MTGRWKPESRASDRAAMIWDVGGGRYQIEIVRSLLLLLQKNGGQPVDGDIGSPVLLADGVVLTEYAGQIAAGKENST